ncbi:hypothetical protein D3C72_1865700 [compost metagenome]
MLLDIFALRVSKCPRAKRMLIIFLLGGRYDIEDHFAGRMLGTRLYDPCFRRNADHRHREQWRHDPHAGADLRLHHQEPRHQGGMGHA